MKNKTKTVEKPEQSEWMCITTCLDVDGRYWQVGDKCLAPKAPAKKHFVLIHPGDKVTILDILREKCEELDLPWTKDWDVKRMEREIACRKVARIRQEAKERRLEGQEIERRRLGE